MKVSYLKLWLFFVGSLIVGYLLWRVTPAIDGMIPLTAKLLVGTVDALIVLVPLSVIVFLLSHVHTKRAEAEVKILEASKLFVTERGFSQRVISTPSRKLLPTGEFHGSVVIEEVPNSYHYQSETELSAAAKAQEALELRREQFAWKKEMDLKRLEPKQLPPGIDVPPACQFSEVLNSFQPTSERILLAYLPNRIEALSTSRGICHAALAGATGGGKSVIIRLIVSQLCFVGATVLLLNPHYTHYDLDAQEDWTPFEPYLHDDPMKCRDYRVIGGYLKQIAEEMLPARLDKYAHSQPIGKPFYVVLDELPAIVKHVPAAPGYMADILREGRKVGIFLVTAAQDFLVKTVMGKDGTGAVRDCFRTAIYVGGDPTTARVLLDVSGAVDDGGLGKGVVMIRSSQVKQASYARIPYVDNESLYRLLGPSTYHAGSVFQKYEDWTPGKPEEDTFEEDSESVIEADSSYCIEPLQSRPLQTETSSEKGIRQPVERSDSKTDGRLKTYRLTDAEISVFIGAYRTSGNIEDSLRATGHGSGYKPHARQIIDTFNLRKEEK